MFTPIFPIIGAALAWLTIYLLGFKKVLWKEFVLGLAIFLLAMFVQSPVQQLPLLAIGITSNQDVILRGVAFTVGTAIWLGLIAGMIQEGFKYIFVRGKNLREAVFIGLGFGITEVAMLVVSQVIIVILLGGSIDAPVDMAILSLIERYFAVLFHIATTMFLAYAYAQGFGKRGLIMMILLHTLIDSMAAYYQLTQSVEIMYIVEGSFAIITALLLYYVIIQIRKDMVLLPPELEE